MHYLLSRTYGTPVIVTFSNHFAVPNGTVAWLATPIKSLRDMAAQISANVGAPYIGECPTERIS